MKETAAEALIGRWLKRSGDNAEAVLGAIQRARDGRVIDPIPWITAAIKPKANGSSHAQENRSVHAAADRSLTAFEASTPTSPELPAIKAKQLFGCFRRGHANDPDTYAAAIAAVLTRFAPEVVAYVTDPRTGLPSRSNWLPTVYEVRLACEERAAEIEWPSRRDALERQQLAERERYEKQRANAPTRAEIEAKLGRAIGNRLRAAYHVTAEQWAAIPDAKPARERA